MTSLEIPNTCFIFVRHSILSPSPTRSKNVEFVFHEAINGRARGFIRTRSGPSVSKLITVPRQVRLVCLCREKIHAALFLPAACSESIESHRFETIIEARRNDLEKKIDHARKKI